MEIKQLIKEAHESAVAIRLYDCQDCEGLKGSGKQLSVYNNCKCKTCNGTGINPNKNIGELLMLIVSELGKALEAHRNNRFVVNDPCIFEWIKFHTKYKGHEIQLFEINIKDTFEDEIADVFIRLFDLCGYLGIEPETHEDKLHLHKNPFIKLSDLLLFTVRCIGEMQSDLADKKNNISSALGYLYAICNLYNIPIEKHIKAKMAYNRTRPRKHGKEY